MEKCEKAATSFYKFGARSQAALKENFAKGRFFCPTAESFKKMAIKHPSVDGTEQRLSVYFTPCDTVQIATCNRTEETKEWLKDKNLLLVYNQ